MGLTGVPPASGCCWRRLCSSRSFFTVCDGQWLRSLRLTAEEGGGRRRGEGSNQSSLSHPTKGEWTRAPSLTLLRGKTGTLTTPENSKANLSFQVQLPPPPFPSLCSALSPLTQLSTSVVETEEGGGGRSSAAPPHTFREKSQPPDLPVPRPWGSLGITPRRLAHSGSQHLSALDTLPGKTDVRVPGPSPQGRRNQ